MRVVQAAFSSSGGAGSVATNTNEILLKNGVESSTWFLTDSSLRGKPVSNWHLLPGAIVDEYLVKKPDEISMFSLFRSEAGSARLETEAEVLHLHWWQDFDLPQMARSNRFSRVVFSLHDDRAFTGGCHSSGNCSGYETGCKSCPLSRRFFHNKISNNYSRTREEYNNFDDVVFVAPTVLMRDKAERAGLMENWRVEVIPNPISLEYWDANPSRAVQSSEKIKLGFIAANLGDKNKRLELALLIVEKMIRNGRNVELETVGSNLPSEFKGKVRNHGPLTPREITAVAASWHGLLLTSSYENSPVVISEMAALGIPTLTDGILSVEDTLAMSGQSPVIGDFTEAIYGSGWKQIIRHIESFSDRQKESLRNNVEKTLGPDVLFDKLKAVYRRG